MFLAGHSSAMVTYCVTKIIPTYLPMIEQFFWYHDCSINWERMVVMTHQNLRLWKVLETVLSHLKIKIIKCSMASLNRIQKLELAVYKKGLKSQICNRLWKETIEVTLTLISLVYCQSLDLMRLPLYVRFPSNDSAELYGLSCANSWKRVRLLMPVSSNQGVRKEKLVIGDCGCSYIASGRVTLTVDQKET